MYNGSSTANPTFGTDQDDAGLLQRGVRQAGDTLHDTIEKVAQPVQAALDKASAGAHQTVDRMACGVHAAAERVDSQTRRLQEMPARAVDHARDYVRGRPLQTVLGALALGWLIGRLGAGR